MKKMTRLFILLFVIGLGLFFLRPTITWYFFYDEADKNDAALSSLQTKEKVQSNVDAVFSDLESDDLDSEVVSLLRKRFLNKAAELNERVENENKFRFGDDKIEPIKVDKSMTLAQLKSVFEQRKGEAYTKKLMTVTLEDHYQGIIEKKRALKGNVIKLGLDLQGGANATVSVDFEDPEVKSNFEGKSQEEIVKMKESMVDTAIMKIRNRIDKFGVSEINIQKLDGLNRISIELPGVKEVSELDQIIETVGKLEFQLVSREGMKVLSDIITDYRIKGETITDQYGNIKLEVFGQLPADTEIIKMMDRDRYGVENEEQTSYVVVEKGSLLSENPQIKTANVNTNEVGGYVIDFAVEGEDVEKWRVATKNNIGREIAIILDDVVLQKPVVQSEIPNGNSRITLGDSPLEDLETLAKILRSGSLNVPLEIAEKNTVGASLGRDTIEKGLWAIVIGTILVLLFMLLYYNIGGIVTDLSLILSFFLLMAGLDMFNGTLTLPGIAGIILTVGMAVDANVIIFERVKEEYRAGKTFKTAVNIGYDKAFWTVFDANITTFAAAIGVSLFGSGPIKGFAVTLCMGIIVSLFTSLFVTRLFMDTLTSMYEFKSLRALSLFRGK